MNFKLHQLKCLQTVADSGSFLAASKELGVAQPALSRKIAELEKLVEQRLFERSSQGVTLTAAGERFLRHARLILQQVDRAEREMELERTDASVEVNFVVPPTLSLFVAAPLVKAVATDYPNIRVRCHETHWDNARQMMESNGADLALVTNGHAFKGCHAETCARDRVYFGGRIDERFHGHAPMDFAEACEMPLVLPGPNFLIRRVLEEAARKRGLRLNIRHELNSGPLLASYLEEGLGYTISIWQTFFEGVARARMFARPLSNPEFERDLTIISAGWDAPDPAIGIVRRYLRNRVRELLRTGILRGAIEAS
ncbi:LysR family transcriptional regulator [Hoeflea alexandrii]|uniref:LysR family transcriptional regulator n=1 Tax=Hoeflea alexandrii TaxID=288436 RepID=UPI0022AEA406|nr:LysR family transcriptional regulator [Hoeflea alexandrii]MCZ4291625.1 LysR family transcriptional regulator [Hoeflea alexandrii]